MVNKALQSLEPRFKQLKKHHELFGFLCNFQELSKETLRKCTTDLEIALTDTKLPEANENANAIKQADIDGRMHYEEIETLKPIPPSEIKDPLKMLDFLACNERSTAFPNLFIALRFF